MNKRFSYISAEKTSLIKSEILNLNGRDNISNCTPIRQCTSIDRKDQYGSPIKKGGKQRVTFKDKLPMRASTTKENKTSTKNELCEVVDIPIIHVREGSFSKSSSIKKRISISKLRESPNKLNPSIQDKGDENNQNEQENCSCVCAIF